MVSYTYKLKGENDPYEKLAALCLPLLLSLSLSAPAALCAGEESPSSPVQEEPDAPVSPEDPDEPIRPLSDGGEVPTGGVVTL